MPSRKRAKGRERKLKQQAREPVERSANDRNINIPEQNIRRTEQEHAENVKCDHGDSKTPRGHPVYNFMNTFKETVVTCENRNFSIVHYLEMTFEEHQRVWKDLAMRKMAIDTMVSIGTDFLIIERNIELARHVWRAIILLDHYDGEGPFNSARSKALEEIAYLENSEGRDVVHFFKKRITCSCLDELYSEIKKCQDRGSKCFHCKLAIKRQYLKTCSRCNFAHYCSKECQISDWASHKKDCADIVRLHESVKKVETARSNEESL